ncbi:MAG: histidine--tRNA ligase [Deltaproteobacteria bacterium]|nr:histidine--tRNA ligase [Deltaproteobacteria bacterium]
MANKPIIEPRILKGFRDTLPQSAIVRTKMINILQDVFAAHGFTPIDTPALEYTETLMGKGSDETDKQMFRFMDNGERDVALRFDLTVPFARYAAMYIDSFGTPFKRYHIGLAWRGEKPQRGRYREFHQCDIDTIGTRSIYADAEILAVIGKALKALDINYRFKINDRNLMNALLAKLQVSDKKTAVLRAIDKKDKLGEDVVRTELVKEAGLSEAIVAEIFSFLALSNKDNKASEGLARVRQYFNGDEAAKKSLAELECVFAYLNNNNISEERYGFDLSITRGLDYYTGLVFETIFLALPEYGSIASGGRYDNLATLYTKRELPGVGGSIGLERILGGFEELLRIEKRISPAQVFVTMIDNNDLDYLLKVANLLRASGVYTEISLETGKLGNQFKYAEKKGIDLVIIAGDAEKLAQTVNLKQLSSGEQQSAIALADLVNIVKSK